jgi:Flp pilus assembly protein TadG
MLVVLIPFFILMIALMTDLGTVYCGYRQLQASTDAAALAAAQALPNTTTAKSDAQLYGGVAGQGKNVYSDLQNVTMAAPVFGCSSTLANEGLPCNLSISPPMYNTVAVTQTASVPLNFLRFFSTALGGPPSVQIATTSRASERQTSGGPYNVAIIVDTTNSMSQSDGDASNCGKASRISCALQGVQTLLMDLAPCSPTNPCGSISNGNQEYPLDEVSLFVFPAVTTASGPIDYCGTVGRGVSLTTVPYANPLPSTATYQIVPFSSDYRTSNVATTLNPSSNLVLATGAYPKTCAGLQIKGGQRTYYAGVIYAAQAALLAQQSYRNDNSQNVIIILSDGDATATAPNNFSGTNINGKGRGTLGNGLASYMSNEDECQQAVAAAWTAAASAVGGNTTIYSISYGSESSGCSSDSYSSLSPVNMQNISPCQTMQNISSTHAAATNSNFFSDYTGGGSSGTCVSSAQPYSNLNQIFTTIAGNFLFSHLIPNGTQ